MAKAAKANTKGKTPPSGREATEKKKKAGPNRFLMLLLCAALVPFSLPTLLLLLVGMLPSLAAVVVEKGAYRYAWVCVGGLNFAALSPWLFKLWFGRHTMAYAIEQIAGISMLLAAYSGAAVGWLLYLGVPPLVRAILSATSHYRLDNLSKLQKNLADQWGEDVSQTPVTAPPGGRNGR